MKHTVCSTSLCSPSSLCLDSDPLPRRTQASTFTALGRHGGSCYDFLEVTHPRRRLAGAESLHGCHRRGDLQPPRRAAPPRRRILRRRRRQPSSASASCRPQPGTYDLHRHLPRRRPSRPHTRATSRRGDAKERGIVRVDPEFPAHFRWEGTQERFFWNGTTTYWLAGWDDDTIRHILDRLDRLKITRVRAALSGRVKDGHAWFEDVFPTDKFSFLLNPWVAQDPASVENPGLRRHPLQRRLLAEMGTPARPGPRPGTWPSPSSSTSTAAGPASIPFGKDGMGGPDEQRYYRYAIARLAPFCNVMWDLANEYRLFRDDAWAEKMGAFVKHCDPYDHLTSTHGHGDFRFGKSAVG